MRDVCAARGNASASASTESARSLLEASFTITSDDFRRLLESGTLYAVIVPAVMLPLLVVVLFVLVCVCRRRRRMSFKKAQAAAALGLSLDALGNGGGASTFQSAALGQPLYNSLTFKTAPTSCAPTPKLNGGSLSMGMAMAMGVSGHGAGAGTLAEVLNMGSAATGSLARLSKSPSPNAVQTHTLQSVGMAMLGGGIQSPHLSIAHCEIGSKSTSATVKSVQVPDYPITRIRYEFEFEYCSSYRVH